VVRAFPPAAAAASPLLLLPATQSHDFCG